MLKRLASSYARFLIKRGYTPPTACYKAGMLFGLAGSDIWLANEQDFLDRWSQVRLWRSDPLAEAAVMRGAGSEMSQGNAVVFDLGHREEGEYIHINIEAEQK